MKYVSLASGFACLGTALLSSATPLSILVAAIGLANVIAFAAQLALEAYAELRALNGE